MGEIEFGTCSLCREEKELIRTYYHYPHIQCECHSPNHFDLVIHCKDCTPIRPRETKITYRTELLL